MGMKAGDMIRVTSWPGTNGRRFRVVRVREERQQVDALEPGQGSIRTFSVGNCHVDRAMTRAERAREEWSR